MANKYLIINHYKYTNRTISWPSYIEEVYLVVLLDDLRTASKQKQNN